eukprot:TRINITY_DN1753_c0_g2_i1.p1 TRINITY_DN1753_c0_g2~~TRINITY_DN1753_c0_g2_i1.p1  ORF type:complete len:424 (-),score=71.10 TRINITY_DN1753_c0_g2_i1:692-1963(-)
MGRKLKKGQKGNATKYVSRTQAIRKLQLPLQLFRRLCILKGIHPREPNKKKHGQHVTYYHTKDIRWLEHEPLLNKFREIKAYSKKIKKAKNKLNHDLARRLLQRKPRYQLDHLVKERYPSFIEALRDLDDPLTLVHLFATLPAESAFDIPKNKVEVSTRLALEWQAYIIRTHSLRKVFVSIKGIYFQAVVMGQQITWLIPHQVGQVLPVDVDYRVMVTFLEFYQTLLQFVLFKLYVGLQLSYPPILDQKLYKASEGLAALVKELAGVKDLEDLKRKNQKAGENQQFSKDIKDRFEQLPQKLKELAASSEVQDDSNENQEDEEVDEEDSANSGEKMIGEAGSDEDGLPEIDSGDEDEEQQTKIQQETEIQNGGTEKEEREKSEVVLDPIAGGSVCIGADDEWGICETLFKGYYFFWVEKCPESR